MALCQNANGQLSAFLIGENGALYRYDQAASGSWGTPQSMGGTWQHLAPVVVANHNGQLSVFMIGENGALYRYDQAASGSWGTPQSMGGTWSDSVRTGRGGQPGRAAERFLGRLQQ